MLNEKYFKSYGNLEAIYDEGWEIWAVTVNEGILDRDRNFVLKQATFQFSTEFFQGLFTVTLGGHLLKYRIPLTTDMSFHHKILLGSNENTVTVFFSYYRNRKRTSLVVGSDKIYC